MKKLDKFNFRGMVLDSPNQFKIGFDLAEHVKVKGKYHTVAISGMGGSALPTDLLHPYLEEIFAKTDTPRITFLLNRYYTLPKDTINKETLHLICSYSGNTEETISAFREALANKLSCIGISSGGQIEAICKKENVPHIKLPIPFDNFQPRLGTGYFISVMLKILINQGLIPDVTDTILKTAKIIKKDLPDIEKEGKKLAKKIAGKTPVIYASDFFRSLAMVWKIKLNENSKTPAFWNYFPELNHNEMIGYTNPQAKFLIIMLRDPDDFQKNLNRYTATAKILKKLKTDTMTLDLQGKSAIEKIFRSLALADFISYYLAMIYEQDPTPVKSVEELKAMLAAMR